MEPKINESIFECIGNTPLVRLQRIPQSEGIECQILVKCEFMNPGGSVKDRIGREMFVAAEKEGRIHKGDTIIEATSGNAGIGLAFVAACKGYKMVITLPEKMSNEKVAVLKSLGAEIIRTPTEAHTFDEDSHYMVARKINKQLENSHILDQYANPNNPLAHFNGTGQEIFDQTGGKVTHTFIGAGTGGTITGATRKLKELNPNIVSVGVDPFGSILAQPETLNESQVTGYQIEGIGYDFIPDALDRSVIDSWVKVGDPEALAMARRLIAEEGLLIGGSSGTAVVGCFKWLKENNLHTNKDLVCVVVLPDSIRNYLSKFCADDWMVKCGFLPTTVLENKELTHFYGKTIDELKLQKIPHYDDRFTVNDAADAFDQGAIAVPLIEGGKVKGIVTRDTLVHGVCKKGLENSNSASKCINKDVVIVPYDTDLSAIYTLLNTNEIVFVKKEEDGNIVGLYGVTKLDLLRFFRKATKELI